MKSNKPRLCIVGNMLGRNPGYITTQGHIVADLFLKEGYKVISISSKLNRVFRLMDMIQTIVFNRKKIDILILEVYSGLSMVMADSVSFLTKLLKIRTIFVLHGGNLPDFASRYRRWTIRVLKRAEILVAPSKFLAREIEKFDFQVRVIPNVIELDSYPYKIRRRVSPKLLWMRSFHPVYNPEMAIKAFSSVRKKNPEATLVMAGVDKGLESKMKSMAHDTGLQDAIRFPGFLNLRAKITEFSDADIYLHTNRIDNMPVSIVEACAMGLPVVATNVGGISDLLSHGENGLLVEDGNVDEMSKSIMELTSNSQLTEKLSVNGRLLAERSSWNSVRKEWEMLFEEILTNKNLVSS